MYFKILMARMTFLILLLKVVSGTPVSMEKTKNKNNFVEDSWLNSWGDPDEAVQAWEVHSQNKIIESNNQITETHNHDDSL